MPCHELQLDTRLRICTCRSRGPPAALSASKHPDAAAKAWKGPNVMTMTQTERSDQHGGTMDSYTKTLRIQTSPHQLYEAVTTVPGIKGWWADNTVANDGEITVRFSGDNFQTLRLMDPTPDKSVEWEWIAQYFPFEGATQTDEWVGTRVSFAIQANDDGSSTLAFTHRGLTPQVACYDLCNAGWNYYLESLKRYLEQGRGTPDSRRG
jgi:uncharacterized protein YndB with AHSA1/START domain